MVKSDKHFLFFIIILVFLCVICLFILFFSIKGQGKEACIYVDGSLYKKFLLTDYEEIEVIEINNEFGYNKIEIKDGKIGVTEADCPDKTCVRTGYTDSSSNPVICMPHRLEIIIIDASTIDGVTD